MVVTNKKAGAFRDWTEDDQQVELQLPLPPNTQKKDVVCVINKTTLVVRHVPTQQTLLRADPLSGPLIAEDSTWYLQGDLLVIVLAKQWRGETKSDQYWGAHLVKTYDSDGMRLKDAGVMECYMTHAQLAKAKEMREKQQADDENERHARVKASQRRERAAREERAQAPSAHRRPRRQPDDEPDEADEAVLRRPSARQPHSHTWLAQYGGTLCLAALGLIILELSLSWRSYWQLAQATLGLFTDQEGTDDDSDGWTDSP